MDIFPDDLGQVYDNVRGHKLRWTGLEQTTTKIIKDWLEQCKEVSQSYCLSSGVAFCGNNLCEKSYCFVKALGLDECCSSCLVNTSLIQIFSDVLEQRYGEYVKTDFFTLSEMTYLCFDKHFLSKKGV